MRVVVKSLRIAGCLFGVRREQLRVFFIGLCRVAECFQMRGVLLKTLRSAFFVYACCCKLLRVAACFCSTLRIAGCLFGVRREQLRGIFVGLYMIAGCFQMRVVFWKTLRSAVCAGCCKSLKIAACFCSRGVRGVFRFEVLLWSRELRF